MNLSAILQNHILLGGLAAWFIAQGLKPLTEFLKTRQWNWKMVFSAGGMPSSHSALIVGVTVGTGLFLGFDSPIFAVALAITMIVVYDAAGVRRQAGMHAERINVLFEELLRGHIWDQNELREVLGHTPLEVTGGILLGVLVSILNWMVWK